MNFYVFVGRKVREKSFSLMVILSPMKCGICIIIVKVDDDDDDDDDDYDDDSDDGDDQPI